MATLTVESGAASIELSTQGLDPPQMVKAIQAGAAALSFATSGSFNRAIRIESSTAALSFDTSSGSSEFVRKELMAGAGIELQVWDRDDPEGTLLEVLQFRGQRFEVAVSQTGAIEIILPARYLNSVLAEEDHHVVVLVDGIERARYIAEDLVEIPVSEDEKQSVKVIGRGIGAILEWGAIAPYDFGGPNQRVKRIWASETRAKALRELFNEIQNRGILQQVIVDGWNGIHDSMGEVWSDLVDLEFDSGGSFLELLDNWTEYGIEWLMSWDFRLQLANSFGRNLASSVVLYPAHTVQQQELSISRRDIRTILFTQDGSGGVQKISDAAARMKWGDREQYVVFGDSLGAGTATSNGYLLLDLVKDAVKERRVEIDPNAPGRRPFVDFDLGDVVGVWFGDDVYEFRVLAIAMASDESGRMRCEVTLEYMLEAMRKRRQKLLNASTAGGGVSSSPQTVYAIGGGYTIGTSKTSILPLSLNAFLSTLGRLGYSIIGTCSGAMTILVEVMYSESVLETFEYTVPAGVQTIEVTWLWTQIPSGEVPMRLRIWTSSGTFTVGANKAQFWIEAKSIAGKQTNAPVLFVNESVGPMSSIVPPTTDSIEDFFLPTMAGGMLAPGESVEAFSEMPTTSDSISDQATFILTMRPKSGSDDGWVTPSTIDTSSTTTSVGNVSGASRSAFYRFTCPIDLTGKTIVEAYLVGVANAASASAATQLTAIDEADPSAPSTYSGYMSATLTTETKDWLSATTSGASITSPNISNIIQELVDSYGDLDHIVIMHRNNGSATGATHTFRSYEYSPTSSVQLVIKYLE